MSLPLSGNSPKCGCPDYNSKEKLLQNSEKPLFTYEERKLLYDCDRASVFERAIPLAAFLSAAAYVGIRKDVIPYDNTLGALPTVALAGFIGFLLGKLSYKSVYTDRYLSLPDEKHGTLYHTLKNLMEGESLMVFNSTGICTVSKNERNDQNAEKVTHNGHRNDKRTESEEVSDAESTSYYSSDMPVDDLKKNVHNVLFSLRNPIVNTPVSLVSDFFM